MIPLLFYFTSTKSENVGCDQCNNMGYFDGCNACGCELLNGTRFAMCTLRYCNEAEKEEAFCYINGCACPHGIYYDGCNQCTCDKTSNTSTCTKMACTVYNKPVCGTGISSTARLGLQYGVLLLSLGMVDK